MKKLFNSYIFKVIVSLLIMSASIIVLMYCFFTYLPDYNWVGIVLSVLIAVIFITILLLINRKMIIRPIEHINTAAKKIAGGEFVKLNINNVDNDLKRLVLNLNNLAYEFKNLEQMRKSFVSNASHEMRSPLTSMQGFLQAILDGTIGENDKEKYLKIVLRETKRLSAMINSMLDLSRMDSGKIQITPSKFELNEVITQIVERFEPNIKRKQIEIKVDLISETSYVLADKEKIIQVIANIVDNAIKYSSAYSKILISTHIHENKIYISVKDQGAGISKKDQMYIWDRFYMIDKARTPTTSKGTGLGLSIVKKIIDEHKEMIWVESKRGEGSTFIFTLPIFDQTKQLTNEQTA